MHLIIRTVGLEDAIVLRNAFEGSRHRVVVHSGGNFADTSADAEFLPMSMAESLGLSPPVKVLQIAITRTPPTADWLRAPFVMIGMLLDGYYSKKEELELLLGRMKDEVTRFNLSNNQKIHSVGIHQDILNMSKLPLSCVADAVLRKIG